MSCNLIKMKCLFNTVKLCSILYPAVKICAFQSRVYLEVVSKVFKWLELTITWMLWNILTNTAIIFFWIDSMPM